MGDLIALPSWVIFCINFALLGILLLTYIRMPNPGGFINYRGAKIASAVAVSMVALVVITPLEMRRVNPRLLYGASSGPVSGVFINRLDNKYRTENWNVLVYRMKCRDCAQKLPSIITHIDIGTTLGQQWVLVNVSKDPGLSPAEAPMLVDLVNLPDDGIQTPLLFTLKNGLADNIRSTP